MAPDESTKSRKAADIERNGVNKAEHAGMQRQIEEEKSDSVDLYRRIESQDERIATFIDARTQTLEDFKDSIFKRMDDIRTIVTTKEDLMGALMARVAMSEKRIEALDGVQRDNEKLNFELLGVIKHLNEMLEKADPIRTKADLAGVAEIAHEVRDRVSVLEKLPGNKAITREETARVTRRMILVAVLSALASGTITLIATIAIMAIKTAGQ